MHGLGNAFKLCGGWPDEVMPELKATLSTGEEAEQGVSFRLQGNHALVQETSKQLQDSLKSDGLMMIRSRQVRGSIIMRSMLKC